MTEEVGAGPPVALFGEAEKDVSSPLPLPMPVHLARVAQASGECLKAAAERLAPKAVGLFDLHPTGLRTRHISGHANQCLSGTLPHDVTLATGPSVGAVAIGALQGELPNGPGIVEEVVDNDVDRSARRLAPPDVHSESVNPFREVLVLDPISNPLGQLVLVLIHHRLDLGLELGVGENEAVLAGEGSDASMFELVILGAFLEPFDHPNRSHESSYLVLGHLVPLSSSTSAAQSRGGDKIAEALSGGIGHKIPPDYRRSSAFPRVSESASGDLVARGSPTRARGVDVFGEGLEPYSPGLPGLR